MKYHQAKILFIATVIILLVSNTSFGQKDIRIKRRNFKIENKEGFKEAWKHRRKADRHFEEGVGFFDEALKHYKIAYNYNSENPALNYKMGVCYLVLRDNEKAIEAFNKALSSEELVATDIFYLLGRAYHLNYQFEEATEYYRKCLEVDILNELEETKKEINVYIRQCQSGIELMNNPVRVNVNNMGPNINSKYDDYGPVIHPNDSILYFTSRRKNEKNDERWEVDNRFYSDIYKSELKDGKWQKASVLPRRIYSKHNDAIIEVTEDPDRLYIYRGDKKGGDIYYYEMKRGKWRGPKKFSSNINTRDKETAISFTEDKRTLFFVSDYEEQTLGKKDIFMANKNNKGKWEEIYNLGGIVNSWLNEEGVYISTLEDRLYFSSEGQSSMGGYDIFYTERDVDGNWEEPVNLGYPVNTPYDDVLFQMSNKTDKKGYFSSIREDTHGKKDLYEVIFLGEEKDYFVFFGQDSLAWTMEPKEELFYKAPEKLAIDTTIYLVGNVLDKKSKEGVKGRIQIIDNEKNKVIATYLSDTLGNYEIRLAEKKKYGVEITAKDYLFFAEEINMNQMEINNDSINKNFLLDKVEVGKKVVLENIYFETGSDKLKPESYAELDRVVKLLENNASIKLEISGHTDNVGSYIANKRLSKARAKSVVDYLVGHGISKSRLTFEGYSFTRPIAPNDTPEGRRRNRRVEFEILEK
jgi:outer membrane protein OmpA-like peptidoglycan-associated protein